MTTSRSPRLAALLSLSLLCALAFPAGLHAQSTPSDATVEREVARKLDAKPELRDVKADVAGGTATLTGQVAEPAQRKDAGNVAEGVNGVKQVRNAILLDPDLAVRFHSALGELKGKMVRLVVNMPLLVVAILIVMFATWFGGFVSDRLHLLKRLSRHNPYMDGLLRNIVRTLVVLGGVLIALDLLGATSLVGAVLGSAGVVGLVLGFAFKDIAENYVSGILLSIRQPFAPGDTVRVDGNEGRVVALTSRSTVLITGEGLNLQLPNAVVFKSVLTNYTRNPRRRFDFTMVIDTHCSWNDAMDIGIRAVAGVAGVLDDPAPGALIKDVSNDGASVQYIGWIDQRSNDLAKTRSEAMRQVRRVLREAGIGPPSPVQFIRLVRDEERSPSPDAANEVHEARDTSTDRTLDATVQAAHAAEGPSLLHEEPPRP